MIRVLSDWQGCWIDFNAVCSYILLRLLKLLPIRMAHLADTMGCSHETHHLFQNQTRLMKPYILLPLVSMSLLLTACTQTDNPQLAICQAVTKQLTDNTVASWDNIEENDQSRRRNISIAFTQTDDTKGTISCAFPKSKEGVVETSPRSVVLNGSEVGTKELLTAGAKASAELLKGTAANTVAKSKELAEEASQMANDAAGKARETALDATKALQQKLEQ